MKYRINKISESDFDVITEDGGIACVYNTGEGITTLYYQTRLTDIDQSQDIFEQLGDGKAYQKDWGFDKPTDEELISDALGWLVVGETEWENDNSIFQDVLNYI